MLFKPYGKTKGLDIWFRFPRPHNPDRDLLNFIYNKGDFDLRKVEAFDRHCNRLNHLSHLPIFMRMNGRKIKEIKKTEPLWY